MNYKIIAALAVAGLVGCAQTSKNMPEKMSESAKPGAAVVSQSIEGAKTAQDIVAVQVEAKVTNVDKKKRMITVRGPEGHGMSFRVGEQVKRFNEISVGDLIVVDYLQSVAYELRKPTAEEKRSPRTEVQIGGRAPMDLPPGAGVVSSSKSIVTIVAIDKKAEKVSVRVPEGNIVTIQARNPERLDKIKVGDTVAVTFTEAVAISLEPKSSAS